jgi:hypothetical protein
MDYRALARRGAATSAAVLILAAAPVAAQDDVTRKFENSSFAAQVQAGIEVPVAPHVAAMGQFRWIVPVQDPGGGHQTFMGGIRFVF